MKQNRVVGEGGDLEVTEECWGLIMRGMALVGRAANEGNQINWLILPPYVGAQLLAQFWTLSTIV